MAQHIEREKILTGRDWEDQSEEYFANLEGGIEQVPSEGFTIIHGVPVVEDDLDEAEDLEREAMILKGRLVPRPTEGMSIEAATILIRGLDNYMCVEISEQRVNKYCKRTDGELELYDRKNPAYTLDSVFEYARRYPVFVCACSPPAMYQHNMAEKKGGPGFHYVHTPHFNPDGTLGIFLPVPSIDSQLVQMTHRVDSIMAVDNGHAFETGTRVDGYSGGTRHFGQLLSNKSLQHFEEVTGVEVGYLIDKKTQEWNEKGFQISWSKECRCQGPLPCEGRKVKVSSNTYYAGHLLGEDLIEAYLSQIKVGSGGKPRYDPRVEERAVLDYKAGKQRELRTQESAYYNWTNRGKVYEVVLFTLRERQLLSTWAAKLMREGYGRLFPHVLQWDGVLFDLSEQNGDVCIDVCQISPRTADYFSFLKRPSALPVVPSPRRETALSAYIADRWQWQIFCSLDDRPRLGIQCRFVDIGTATMIYTRYRSHNCLRQMSLGGPIIVVDNRGSAMNTIYFIGKLRYARETVVPSTPAQLHLGARGIPVWVIVLKNCQTAYLNRLMELGVTIRRDCKTGQLMAMVPADLVSQYQY
jgi:hypothetical protein